MYPLHGRIAHIWLGVVFSAGVSGADPFEPDNNPGEAIVVNDNLKQSGRAISPAGEYDSYRFTLSGSTTVVMETNRRPVVGSESLFVSFYDAGIHYMDGTIDSIAMDFPAGTFFGVVEAANQGVVISDYDIGISLYPHSPDSKEPNESIGQSKALSPRVLNRFLNLTPASDVDFFTLNAGNKGGSAKTVVQATSAVRNVTFALFTSAGNDETPFEENQNELIVNLSPGNHFLRVTDYENEGAVPSYTLTYWPISGADPYEDDDSPATASTARTQGADHTSSGHEQFRNIFPLNDVDWIRIYVEDADSLVVKAPAAFGDDPQITLFDSTGTTILGAPSESLTDYANPPDGFYLIRIQQDPGVDWNSENLYRLSVETIPIPRFTQGTIAGTVAVASDSSPINGASIQVMTPVSVQTTTASNGVYLIDALPQGAYSIRASKSGFQSQTLSVQVGASVVNLSFTLSAAGATDLNGDNAVNAVDVQLAINGALGVGPSADVNNDGQTNAVDVQLVINAALGL